MITNKTEAVQIKMREARFWPKMKFEPIFFSSSWAVFRNRKPRGKCWRVIVQNAAFSSWRRGRDLNPRDSDYLPTRFRVERFQPGSATSPFILVFSE